MAAERRFRRLKATELTLGVYQVAKYNDGIAVNTITDKVAT